MATVPLHQLGKHYVSGVLTPQSVSTAGVLADVATAAVTITAVINQSTVRLTPEHEEINALNTTRRNQVITSDGATVSLSVLKVNNGGDPTPLRTAVYAYDYFKYTQIEGTGGSARTTTAYFTRGEYSDGFQGRGQQVASLELVECDPGTSQVVVS